ncbi:MAG: ABC transporter ATP-binding protein, partial [Anaerolineae bacterium]|nr:ABC transporter ATP-binding protein [Anaerolineae bacterium]
TLLRIVAGLETPDRGRVVFDGQDMQSVPVHRRGFGLMFQDFALFPHKNVWANVAFGLRMQGLPRAQIEERVSEALTLVNLSDLARRDVYQLSGGERQRVALARSLAPRPRLLLLDEPLGSLDRTLRDRLLEELKRILKRVNMTTIYVTHDQAEAFAIADRVILMNQGRVVQEGKPVEVYRRPANAWAARFLGMQNLLPGQWMGIGIVQTKIGPLQADGCGQGDVTLLIRPDAAHLASPETAAIRGVVAAQTFLGALARVVVRCTGGTSLTFDLPARDIPPLGQPVALSLDREGVICLDKAHD